MFQFTRAPPASIAFFLLIITSVVFLILWSARKIGRLKHVAFFLTFWVGTNSAVVISGALRDHVMPLTPILAVSLFAGAIWFAMSEVGGAYARLPVWWLIVFQGFRLPLELVLHVWFKSGTIPETMTWSGSNFDILAGLLALLAFLPALRSKTYAWIFNILGLGLLINVIRVAILSAPLPFAWPLDRPLLLLFYFPYSLIAGVGVWSAMAGHLVLTRALLGRDKIAVVLVDANAR